MERKTIEIEAMRPGISIPDYIRMDACGGSDLENMRRSPRYCKMMQDRDDEPSEARDFGTATHTTLLEPHRAPDSIGFLPEGFTARSKENKAHLAAMRDKYEVVLKHERMAELAAVTDSVAQHEYAQLLLDHPGACEMTGTVSHPSGGGLVKIRPDKLVPTLGTVLELKTTRATTQAEFEKQAWNLGYHRKASFVMAVLRWMKERGVIKDAYDTYAFLAIANTAPHEVGVFAMSSIVLEREEAEWQPHLERYFECHETNEWPGWTQGIEILEPPAWMRKNYEGGAL